jgi:hypothetical protein
LTAVLAAPGAFVHHLRQPTPSTPDIYSVIDSLVADTPRADLIFTDVGDGMTDLRPMSRYAHGVKLAIKAPVANGLRRGGNCGRSLHSRRIEPLRSADHRQVRHAKQLAAPLGGWSRSGSTIGMVGPGFM